MNPRGPRNFRATLYVGDLHQDINRAILYQKFSTAGAVYSIKVCSDKATGRSLGYAYVNFYRRTDAQRALDTLNFDVVMGKPMRIMWYEPDPTMRRSTVGNVYLHNLDESICSKALYDTFSIFGHISSCKVVCDEKGKSKGYGFVHFTSQEVAHVAIEKLNGMMFNDRKAFLMPYKTRQDREAEKRQWAEKECEVELRARAQEYTYLLIKNFGEDISNDKLNEVFRQYGEIQSVSVVTDDSGMSRDFGFVCFKRPGDAQRAVKQMNGRELNGRRIYVGIALKKGENRTVPGHKSEQTTQEQIMGQEVNPCIQNKNPSVSGRNLGIKEKTLPVLKPAGGGFGGCV